VKVELEDYQSRIISVSAEIMIEVMKST